MAQLVKLRDYVSRYEWDAYRYPSQYIRLKHDNWEKLYKLWLKDDLAEEKKTNTDQSSGIFKLWEFMNRSKKIEEIDDTDHLPTTKDELKHYFLDNLYPFQLTWATSTVSEISFMDKKYENDETLKYFLQRFPDIYLMMYYPVFNINNSVIDGEIIMISPLSIEIIYLLEKAPQVKFMAGNERTWTTHIGKQQNRILSPMIALKRNEHIIHRILKTKNINMPIQKTILSRTNHIMFTEEPYRTKVIGKLQYKKWFNKKRQLLSPLKSNQLKTIEALLDFCHSSSVKRPEWEEQHHMATREDED